ncbi:MAG: NAD(P)-binding protein [bacterium]
MKIFKYVILGAGPSGLSIAHALVTKGVALESILVVEKENEAGGLCRSKAVEGAPLDIGGGHFLDIKNKKVVDFLQNFLHENEWQEFNRVAKINIFHQHIDHPFEANLWQLPVDLQVNFLESVAQSGFAKGNQMPANFEEWVRWKFGERIADDYLLPYNRKIWSMELSRLGIYWLYKLPDVSFREILYSCLQSKAHGKIPAHAKFLYPKNYGYGEVWKRMGDALGKSLRLGIELSSLDCETLIINNQWKAETIISTIPWMSFCNTCNLPGQVVDLISQLINVGIDIDYFDENIESDAHWIYEPHDNVIHHRKLLRKNFLIGSRGYWTETNTLRSKPKKGFRHTNPFAYPVNTIDKPKVIQSIAQWAHSKNIIPLGRWGKWEHMNSDVAVAEALELAHTLYPSDTR